MSQDEIIKELNENYKWYDNVSPNPYEGKIFWV